MKKTGSFFHTPYKTKYLVTLGIINIGGCVILIDGLLYYHLKIQPLNYWLAGGIFLAGVSILFAINRRWAKSARRDLKV